MPSFPTSVFSPASRSNGQTLDASHVNDVQDEIVAIEGGYLNGTARLNSSNSTVANLSVAGGSTFAGPVTCSSGVTISSGGLTVSAGNVTIGSTGGGSTLTVRGSTQSLFLSASTHGMSILNSGTIQMASGSTRSLGSTTRGFLFVDENGNVKGGLFYLRGTGNAVNKISDVDSGFSTVTGGGASSTGTIAVAWQTDHYTIENRLGATVDVRLTLIGG